MRIRGMRELPALAFFVLCCGVGAQPNQTPGCDLEPPAFTSSAANIFSDKQEQDLGDALAEYFESDMRIAAPAADDQLTKIGERLLATLPPSGIHYKFRIYESGEINGFSFAGGHVYISRKLITAVKSEDALAGVVAHEIGHIATHQNAIRVTRMLRQRLGLTEVGDRADIFAKLHKLWSTPGKLKEEGDTEEKRELMADRVALYELVRAGYSPESYASFLNEVTMNKGKMGNWLSDLVGETHEETKRYHAAIKLVEALPPGCKGKPPAVRDAFSAWLHNTIDERVKTVAEGIDGDKPLTLDPPLRPSLWRIRFSPDGRFLLAQDETGINVLDRNALKVLFRIDAPDVESAKFSPDSANVVFQDAKLRVEKWNIATGKRTSVKELVVYDGCRQTLLSSDAKTLVCAFANIKGTTIHVGVRLIDVESGNVFFENASLYDSSPLSWSFEPLWYAIESGVGFHLMAMFDSPNGKYLMIDAGDKLLAFDLDSRQPVQLAGKIKDRSLTRMAFIGNDQLYVAGEIKSNGVYKARVLRFPSGEVVKEGEIGDQAFEAVTKGQTVIAGPLKDYAVGILDPMQGKFLTASKLGAIDAWDTSVALENAMGGVAVGQFGVPGTKQIPLTLGPLPVPKAAAFSPDGKYLAISMKNRAAVWNLETGKQVKLVRPFTSVWMDKDGHLYGQFPKFQNWEPAEMQFTMDPFVSKELTKLEEHRQSYQFQYHDLQLIFKPMDKGAGTHAHATLEVKKMETQGVAWSRDYKNELPTCWSAEDDRLVLAWGLDNDTARSEIKSYPALRSQLTGLKNQKKGFLLETVVPETGTPLQQVVIPAADSAGTRNEFGHAMVSGQFILANGEHGNTAIYRIADGSKVGEFFGWALTSDAASGVIAAVNRDEEIILIEERSGKELKRFTFGSPVRLARIITGKEKTLLVLTADQVVHRMPLPEQERPPQK